MSSQSMNDAGFIIGIGETPVGRFPGRNALDLQAEAIQKALEDCGLAKRDVDALYAVGSYIRPLQFHGLSLADYLGITPRFQAAVDVGGTVSFISMVHQALAGIAAGRMDVAVCVYGDNTATHRAPNVHGFVPLIEQGTEEFEDPFGSNLVVAYALIARRYLELYGLEPEQAFGPIAVSARRNASLNPNAAYGKLIDMDEYRASPWIVEPFRRLDCSPAVDGAGAFVIASARVAARLGLEGRAIRHLGSGTRVTHKHVSQMPDIADLGFAGAAEDAFREADLGPDDVDLLLVHDGFTSSVAIAAEAMGLCPPGACGIRAAHGEIDFDGKIPINTHGGLLGQGHVGGVLHVVEAVRQLRGSAGARQVKNAKVAAIAGVGNVMSIAGVMLLGQA
jgi:acetyl-CoA acetyltransferase